MNQMHTIPYALPFYNRLRIGSYAYANTAYLHRAIFKISFATPGTGYTAKGVPSHPTTIAHVYTSEGFLL